MENAPRLAPGMQIGDYHLKELISEGSATRTWYAEQISVRREVIVDSLRSAILLNDSVREAFLEDVRAKARVDHPLIGSVFEAVKLEDVCFYARERLAGETLERYVERGDKLPPAKVVHILKQIAEANLYLERNNIGSIALGPHQIYIGDKHLTRLVNMAIGEQRDHAISVEDKVMLGRIFKEITDRREPGATRVNSLCDFMVDRNREIPITWEQIRDLSEQVEKQLREQPVVAGKQEVTVSLRDKDVMRNTAIVLAAAILILALVGLITWKIAAPKPTSKRNLDQVVDVDVLEIEVQGEKIRLATFSMDMHEVTIAEYAEFLEAVKVEGFKAFAPEGMPKDKESYAPGGEQQWSEMYAAAKGGLKWKRNERVMGVNQPVFNVDWWSARAYAKWKTQNSTDEKFSLPSEAQWLAALVDQEDSQLKPGVWGVVDGNEFDVTQSGLHGMAGGVSEWTSSYELGLDGRTKRPIVMGASFNDQSGGVKKRQVLSNGRISRDDLGFRLVRESR